MRALAGGRHAKLGHYLRFLRIEPQLDDLAEGLKLEGIDWVICGGESGLHLRQDPAIRERRGFVDFNARRWQPRLGRVDWVRRVRDACVQAGVPFFFKQWGGPKPDSAGHQLDGRTWEEFPR
jgi:protein gp37